MQYKPRPGHRPVNSDQFGGINGRFNDGSPSDPAKRANYLSMEKGSPYTIAEETLGAASMQRGMGGMERTAAPKGPNMYDGGAASKVQLNTQPYNNQRLQQQNILQNTGSAATQANSGAVQQVRKQQLVQDNAEYKACLLYTSPSPRDGLLSRMPSSA